MNSIEQTGIGVRVGSRFFLMLCGVLLIAVGGCKKVEVPVSAEVTWKTQDGFAQHGTIYTPEVEMPPGMILVHQDGGSRGDWEHFALRARSRGYLVLAYDMRGHGESIEQGGHTRRFNAFDRADWERAIGDIGLAKDQLLAAGASPENIFIVGASAGGSLAFLYGTSDSAIQGMVLLSPGVEYRGIDISAEIKENRRLPVLLMTAEGDRYSADSAREMKAWSQGYTELRSYAGTSHGADLTMRSEQVLDDLFGWLDPIVK